MRRLTDLRFEEAPVKVLRFAPVLSAVESPEAELTISGPYDAIRRAYEGMGDGVLALVDRARFERLLAVAHAADQFERFLEDPELDRLRDAVLELEPSDLDPLP